MWEPARGRDLPKVTRLVELGTPPLPGPDLTLYTPSSIVPLLVFSVTKQKVLTLSETPSLNLRKKFCILRFIKEGLDLLRQ